MVKLTPLLCKHPLSSLASDTNAEIPSLTAFLLAYVTQQTAAGITVLSH